MGNWRLKIWLGFIFLCAAIIISRLFYVQVLNGKLYQAQALGQQVGFQQVQGERGQIFLSNSKNSRGQTNSGQTKSLAINQDTWTMYTIPRDIANKAGFAKDVSSALGESVDSILSKLNQSDSYAVLKKNISTDQENSLKALNIAHVYFEKDLVRFYPQNGLGSQLVGFVGGDSTGQYGIEGYYNDVLMGKSGIDEKKSGLDLIATQDSSSLDGSDLYLTIDYNIQFQAEALLAQVKKNINIDSGQIIVIKPDSGRVIALANYPNFDPNEYSKENDFGIFQDSLVQKVFEPGSIFKPFTMAMGLEEGKITPDTTFTDPGFLKIGPDTLYNFDHKSYGNQTMSGILEKSINTGAVFVEQKIPHQTFLDYLDKFGFSEKTNIDVQGEVVSRNNALRSAPDFTYATAAFGQGIEMTPIQLAKAFCVFANQGKMPQPYVVDKVVHGQDQLVTQGTISRPVISAKTASEVTTMMINVVERGFGSQAKIDGYYLAGKTGTAQVPYPDRKGYYPDRTIQSFIGFGPALKPQFLILVKLDDPKVPESALSATPVFKQMAKYIIDYWQIPPDY